MQTTSLWPYPYDLDCSKPSPACAGRLALCCLDFPLRPHFIEVTAAVLPPGSRSIAPTTRMGRAARGLVGDVDGRRRLRRGDVFARAPPRAVVVGPWPGCRLAWWQR